MSTWRVTVPIVERMSEGLGGWSATRLPSTNVAPGFDLRRQDDEYEAEVLVQAVDADAAREVAVARVRDLLVVIAIQHEGFDVAFSRVEAEAVPDASPPREDTGGSLVLEETIVLGERVGVVREIGSLETQARYLSMAHDWPDHLRRGLDLNYSAVLSSDQETKYLLWTAALDVLAWKKLGRPAPLVRNALGLRYRVFKACTRRFFRRWRFTPDQVERLMNHLLQTHAEPVAVHLQTYLASIEVDGVELAQLAEWWAVRGMLAHGDSVPADRLRASVGDLVGTTRAALRRELEVLVGAS